MPNPLYQCICGKTFTNKILAALHMQTVKGNHIVKKVQ